MRVLMVAVFLFVSVSTGLAAEKWHFSETVDPIDDTVTSAALLAAREVTGADKVYFGVICEENIMGVSIFWGSSLGLGLIKGQEVKIRLDSLPAEIRTWQYGGEQTILIAGEARSLIERLVNVEKLTVRTSMPIDRTVTAIFGIAGMREAIAPISEKCGWDLPI